VKYAWTLKGFTQRGVNFLDPRGFLPARRERF